MAGWGGGAQVIHKGIHYNRHGQRLVVQRRCGFRDPGEGVAVVVQYARGNGAWYGVWEGTAGTVGGAGNGTRHPPSGRGITSLQAEVIAEMVSALFTVSPGAR